MYRSVTYITKYIFYNDLITYITEYGFYNSLNIQPGRYTVRGTDSQGTHSQGGTQPEGIQPGTYSQGTHSQGSTQPEGTQSGGTQPGRHIVRRYTVKTDIQSNIRFI